MPFLPRPVVDPFVELGGGSLGSPYEPWSKWLVWDQRFVEGRTDVLAYQTPVLTEPVRVQGVPIADIRAMTTGTDGDFVVKLIDVYPDNDVADVQVERLPDADRDGHLPRPLPRELRASERDTGRTSRRRSASSCRT